MNGVEPDAGFETLNAASIIVPSMIACGLNHVTTKAVVMVFHSVFGTSDLAVSLSGFARNKLMPM